MRKVTEGVRPVPPQFTAIRTATRHRLAQANRGNPYLLSHSDGESGYVDCPLSRLEVTPRAWRWWVALMCAYLGAKKRERDPSWSRQGIPTLDTSVHRLHQAGGVRVEGAAGPGLAWAGPVG